MRNSASCADTNPNRYFLNKPTSRKIKNGQNPGSGSHPRTRSDDCRPEPSDRYLANPMPEVAAALQKEGGFRPAWVEPMPGADCRASAVWVFGGCRCALSRGMFQASSDSASRISPRGPGAPAVVVGGFGGKAGPGCGGPPALGLGAQASSLFPRARRLSSQISTPVSDSPATASPVAATAIRPGQPAIRPLCKGSCRDSNTSPAVPAPGR